MTAVVSDEPAIPALSRPLKLALLAMVVAAGILNYLDRQVIAVLKVVIGPELHWTDADYGLLASVFQGSAAMAYLFAGRIVDRVGVRWANPLAVGSWSLAALAHGLITTFPSFLGARVALGATESMGTPTGIKTIATLLPASRRAVAIGVSNAANTLGAILTPLFVPAVAMALGWRKTFVLLGVAGLVWTVAWLGLVRLTPRDFGLGAVKTVASDEAPAQRDRPISLDRRAWAIGGAKALSDQVWWLMLFWIPDFFHRVFGLTLQQTAAPIAVIYACAAVGSLLAGWASTRMIQSGLTPLQARQRALLVCAILVTPAPLALHVQAYWSAVALLGLLLAAHQGYSVNLFASFADVFPARRVGAATAFGSLVGNLAGMLIVFITGQMLTHHMGYEPLFWLAGASYLLGLGWMRLLLPGNMAATTD